MVSEEITRLIQLGKLSSALAEIEHFNPHQYLQGKVFSSRIREMQGKYQEAYDLAAEALALSMEEGRTLEELGSRVALAYAQLRLKQYDACLITIYKAEALLDTFDPVYYQQVKQYEATLLNIRGLNSRYQGNLSEALTYYQQSLEIRAKLGLEHAVASSLVNMGDVYLSRGELDRAFSSQNHAREIFEHIRNEPLLAYTYHELGKIFWSKNDFEIARNYLDKALQLRIQYNLHPVTASTLLDLINLSIEFEEIDQARYYYDILSEIAKQEMDIINIFYQLATVSIKCISPRLKHRAEAQQILTGLLQHSTLPTDLWVHASLSLCNLYLLDLKTSKNEEIIEKVSEIIRELFHTAKRQNSSPLLIQTMIIQAKLALVELDLEQAQHLLFQAEVIAWRKELTKLAIKVSAEHDLLIDKLNKWDQLKKRNASLIERIEASGFKKTFDNVRYRKNLQIDRELESAMFLLILNQDAVTIYSVKFNDDAIINEPLIGGFLIASDHGMGVALNHDGKIERIKYGDHRLIFIHHDNLIFCYGYQGQSYFAIKRLRDFIDRIHLGRSWQLLSATVPRPKLIEQDLASKVDDYFSHEGIYSRQLLN